MRLLVAIAHHGTKNRPHLDRMLESLRAMPYEVHVVVLTEAPKQLPPDVEQRVGLPNSNPWSLPFAHRRLFVEQLEEYDLFLYSEDDTLIEERHVEAHLELSAALPDGYLPGLMRYEVDAGGRRSMCTVHSHYRWDPASAFTSDGRTFGRFTNDHGACYMLTREQLRAVIASGGYELEPHEGRYDMLVSAATDPYTRCGHTKVFCLERMEDQLVHHLPNVYLGKLGISEQEFDVQVAAMRDVAAKQVPADQLLDPEVAPGVIAWSKHVFPRPEPQLLDLVSVPPGHVLAFGAVSAVTESLLLDHGYRVTALPVDAVIGTVAAARGLSVLEPNLDALEALAPSEIDQLVAFDVLAYLRDPVEALRRCRRTLRPGARALLTVPDHRRYRWRNQLPVGEGTPLPHSFERDGIHSVEPKTVRAWLTDAGFTSVRMRHRRATRRLPVGRGGLLAALSGNTLLVTASNPG